jgi:hypothetical protein
MEVTGFYESTLIKQDKLIRMFMQLFNIYISICWSMPTSLNIFCQQNFVILKKKNCLKYTSTRTCIIFQQTFLDQPLSWNCPPKCSKCECCGLFHSFLVPSLHLPSRVTKSSCALAVVICGQKLRHLMHTLFAPMYSYNTEQATGWGNGKCAVPTRSSILTK